MKLVETNDKQNVHGQANLQWNKYKSATTSKQRVFVKVLKDVQFYSEFSMTFELKKEAELQQIEIGILYHWSTYDPDHSTEPLMVMVEGGMEKDKPEWAAVLHKVDDDSYKLNCVSVYVANFTKSSCMGDELLDAGIEEMNKETVSSIVKRKAKYLRFCFRNPIQALIDYSSFGTC